MDGNGSLFGALCGNSREVITKFTVDLPKKHGRGGQSALRFARLRLEKRHNYVRKVSFKDTVRPRISLPSNHYPTKIQICLLSKGKRQINSRSEQAMLSWNRKSNWIAFRPSEYSMPSSILHLDHTLKIITHVSRTGDSSGETPSSGAYCISSDILGVNLFLLHSLLMGSSQVTDECVDSLHCWLVCQWLYAKCTAGGRDSDHHLHHSRPAKRGWPGPCRICRFQERAQWLRAF